MLEGLKSEDGRKDSSITLKGGISCDTADSYTRPFFNASMMWKRKCMN